MEPENTVLDAPITEESPPVSVEEVNQAVTDLTASEEAEAKTKANRLKSYVKGVLKEIGFNDRDLSTQRGFDAFMGKAKKARLDVMRHMIYAAFCLALLAKRVTGKRRWHNYVEVTFPEHVKIADRLLVIANEFAYDKLFIEFLRKSGYTPDPGDELNKKSVKDQLEEKGLEHEFQLLGIAAKRIEEKRAEEKAERDSNRKPEEEKEKETPSPEKVAEAMVIQFVAEVPRTRIMDLPSRFETVTKLRPITSWDAETIALLEKGLAGVKTVIAAIPTR